MSAQGVKKDSHERPLEAAKNVISDRAYSIFRSASDRSEKLLADCAEQVDAYIAEHELPADQICVVALGSVGRREATNVSDLDLIPILGATIPGFNDHDQALRAKLREALNLKVSNGEALTKYESLDELAHDERIGGDRDDSESLTKRVLILTEAARAGGGMPLGDVRRRLVGVYGSCERTRGRHFLSLSNDVARYYRTLCIEYKAKVDVEGKDWGTRNVKLRHSRKFWYFSTMLALAAQPHVNSESPDHLLDTLNQPPLVRLLCALKSQPHAARGVLEPYALFVEFMGSKENREALAAVEYEKRYLPALNNPFPGMKANSDLLHREMINLLEGLDRFTRDRILDWFLL